MPECHRKKLIEAALPLPTINFETVNRIYSEHFSAPYPARATVQAAALPRGARIEIAAVASRSAA